MVAEGIVNNRQDEEAMGQARITMQDSEILRASISRSETVRKFAKSLAPHAEEWDEAGIFPRDFQSSWRTRLIGHWPRPEYGGLGSIGGTQPAMPKSFSTPQMLA